MKFTGPFTAQQTSLRFAQIIDANGVVVKRHLSLELALKLEKLMNKAKTVEIAEESK